MQDKSNVIRIKRKPFFFALFVLILAIATPVLADYLGPDRTTTTSEVDTYDYGVWARDNDKVPYCLDKKGNKADDCIVCEWKRKPGNACGDATYSYTLGTKSEVVEITVNLPPATISSSLQNCSLNNGWCNTASELSLNGTEPLSGYNILAIEGSLNGQTFACSGSNCNVPLNEGNNDLSFWALSSYGDSSEMGTLSAKVDTVSPNVGLDVIGSNGTNNWYVSPTTITASGSDSTSGVSSIQLSVNGGAWTASTSLKDGIYAVDVRAEDNAGNVSNSSTTISVDTVTPSVSLNVNGTLGSNGWYSSNMQVTASASDLTSGIASLEVSTDSGVYQAYTSPVPFTDGYHTIQFKATDNAGNQTKTPIQEFYVDTTAPAIDLPASWEVNKTIEYNVQDNGSGLAALRIVIEDEDEKYAKITWDEEVSGNKFKGEITWNGKFRDGTIAPPGEYLVWIKAKDQAGNERFGLGRVIVPQPNAVFALLQPATTNNQETLLPPQELFDEDELPITNSSATTTPQQNLSFGESVTDPKESTQTSLSLATGTASASTATNSNVLWGATAAALIGWATATALEEKKKRKEQEAKKLQEDYAKAAKLNALEEQRKINAWLEGQAMLNAYIEEVKMQGATDTEIAELREQGATQSLGTAIGSATNLYQNLAVRNAARNVRMEAKMMRREMEEDAQQEATEAARLRALAEQEDAKQQALQDHRAREQDTSAADAWTQAQEQPSFWENPLGWFQETPVYTEVVKPFVVQPVNTVIQTISSPIPQPTQGGGKLTVPVALDDDPPNPLEKLVEKGKELANIIKEKATETKRWFTGEDVGYQGSGWGHGPRQWIAKQLHIDNNASNLFELAIISLLQFDQVNLTGRLVENLKNDPAMKEKEEEMLNAIYSDPRYGKEGFPLEYKFGIEFGGNRTTGDMGDQLVGQIKEPFELIFDLIKIGTGLRHVRNANDFREIGDEVKAEIAEHPKYLDTWKVALDPESWTTRHANVNTYVEVEKDGTITIAYDLDDELDLRPDTGGKFYLQTGPSRSQEYNTIVSLLGIPFHDIFGGNDALIVNADWSQLFGGSGKK